jgi:TolA-binding protein
MQQYSKWVSTLRACVLGISLIGLTGSALAATKEEKPTLSAEVVAKLKPAQDAIKKGKVDKGIELAKEGLALAKKPYEKDQALQYLRFCYGKKLSAIDKNADADGYNQTLKVFADVLEQMEALGTMNVDDRIKNLKWIAPIRAQNKDYEGAVKFATLWAQLSEGTKNADTIHEAYAFLSSLYLNQKDYAHGAEALEKAVAGTQPTQTELLQLNSSYYNLKDNAKREAALTQLANRFPKPDYLADLIFSYQEANTPDSVMLQMYRFVAEFGFMTRESQYVEYVDMANNIGSPTEAAKAMHKGVDTGAVKIISPTDKNSRLMKLVDQGAADDKRDMAKIEKELVARKNGDIDIKLGMSLLMAGETDRAIESFNRGLSAERIAQVKKPDDAYMLLGLAQYRKGDKAAAIAAFTQAKASTDMAKVADLWLNRLAAN